MNNFEVFCQSYGKYYSHAEVSSTRSKRKLVEHQFIHHNRVLLYQEEKGEPYKFAITNGRSTCADDCVMINTLQMMSHNHHSLNDTSIFKYTDFNQPARAVRKEELYGIKNEIINVEAEVDSDFQVLLKREIRLLESAISLINLKCVLFVMIIYCLLA